MEILAAISSVILGIIFFLPTSVYGAVIGNRIANNEFRGKWYKKMFCIPLFAIIGAGLFPFTYMLMIAKWEDISYDIDRFVMRFLKM